MGEMTSFYLRVKFKILFTTDLFRLKLYTYDSLNFEYHEEDHIENKLQFLPALPGSDSEDKVKARN